MSFRKLVEEAARRFGFPSDYETDQLELFARIISTYQRFIDVGANRGIYSYIANIVAHNAEIFSIEANPLLSGELKVEAATWPKGQKNNVNILSLAVSDGPADLPFFLSPQDTHGTLSAKSNIRKDNVVNVKADSLDNLFKPDRPTFVKIDVEGFEYRALAGAKQLLSGDTRVFVELHGWGDPEIGKYPYHVVHLMRDFGFSCTRIGQSYAYDFRHASFLERNVSFYRYAPILGAKFILRTSGIRALIKGSG
jgi:FkbM family methyltransferase